MLRRKSSGQKAPRYQSLEKRNLLAGISLSGSTLQIFGTDGADTSVVSQSGSTIVATLTNFDSRSYPTSSVTSIVFVGSNGNDRFTNGTSVRSSAFGGTGDDLLIGGSGNDFLNGNSGRDDLRGGAGDDTLLGGGGGIGSEQLNGNAGNDSIFGGTGANTVNDTQGNNLIFGGPLADTIVTGNGNDQVYPGPGDDVVNAGNGNNIVIADAGNDQITAGNGIDLLYGGSGDDNIVGGGGNDTLDGQLGNDQLFGGTGSDVLDGSVGDDRLDGGSGGDLLFGGAGNDVIFGRAGSDNLFGYLGNDDLYGGADNDGVYGGEGLDSVSGGAGGDAIGGGGGADRFLSFAGEAAGESIDLTGADARLIFSGGWNENELAIVDRGLRKLHDATGGTRVFKDSLDNSILNITKLTNVGNSGEAGFNRLQNRYTYIPGSNTLSSEVFTREIQIRDFNESNESQSEFAARTMIHEIAHSWDSSREIGDNFSGQGGIWTRFLAASGWRNSAASGFIKSSSQTSEPFDLVFVNGTPTQQFKDWYYRSTATFARSYGSSNPKEDWSTIWEAAVSDDPADRIGVQAKVNIVQELFRLL